MQNQTLGIAWMILHCLLIAVMAAMIRVIAEPYHILQIVFFHNAVAFVCILPWVWKEGLVAQAKTRKLPLHLWRGVLGYVSMLLYFYAITVIPLTQARAIALAGPLISSFFAIIFLKESSNWHKTTALLIGLAGSLLILRPDGEGFSLVTLLVVAAVCMWSVIDMLIKLLSQEATTTQMFYLTGVMTLCSLPGAVYVWKTPANLHDWLWLVGIGVVFLVNILSIFNAFRHADITTIMPFDFTGMVFTAAIAYVAFGEVIEPVVWIGGAVIVASSVYIVRREMRGSKAVPEGWIEE